MPNLGGAPQRRKINLSGKQGEGSDATEEESRPRSPAPPPARRPPVRQPQSRPVRTTLLEDDDDDGDDEDDEIIQASLQSGRDKKLDPKLMIGLGLGVVVIVVMVFLLVGGRKQEEPYTPPPSEPVTEQKPPAEQWGDDSLGIQDFTQNTEWQSTSPLTDPNGFVEDIHGLTTRVDYNVSAIQSNVVDFVNYTKKRGTWGGGLELYWLDCTYKGNQYVVQVPFQYYKELDDEGIVAVKMEVVFVKEANGDTLSIVTYMCLDEATIKTLLKSKK